MPRQKDVIVGDVTASSDVSVNRKGGSVTTTLKKVLRERLNLVGNHMYAATMQFSSGQSLLLMRGETENPRSAVRVTQVARNRFEIELADDGDDDPVDDLTAAFVMAKRELFKKGELELTAPVSADDFEREVQAKFEQAEQAAPGRLRSG